MLLASAGADKRIILHERERPHRRWFLFDRETLTESLDAEIGIYTAKQGGICTCNKVSTGSHHWYPN